MSEKLTPPTKKINRADGLKDGGQSTLTTPKKDVNKFWADRSQAKEKILS